MMSRFSFSSCYCTVLALAVLLGSISAIALERCGTSGCQTRHDSDLGQTIDISIQSNNGADSVGTRRFLVYLPRSYVPGTPTPVIFSYHGQGKTRQYQKDLDHFSDESINPNMIVVYPQALKDPSDHVSPTFLSSHFNRS